MDSHNEKKLISFLVVGTQKGGTTALDSFLRSHPLLALPNCKELHYFDRENFPLEPDHQEYHNRFPNSQSVSGIYGECTPSYMFIPDAAKRIHQYNPLMKLIILLRNPMERAYSHWNMQRIRNLDDLPFDLALMEEEKRVKKDHLSLRRYSYSLRGYFAAQIKHLSHYFPLNQMLILRSEQLLNTSVDTLSKISDFLNIAPFPNPARLVHHQLPYSKRMNDRARSYILERLSDDIMELEKILDWDCSDWLRRP